MCIIFLIKIAYNKLHVRTIKINDLLVLYVLSSFHFCNISSRSALDLRHDRFIPISSHIDSNDFCILLSHVIYTYRLNVKLCFPPIGLRRVSRQ